MKIKKYVLIGIGAFSCIVALVIGISARFSLSNITSDPFSFIENFFHQWSPALAAAGTITVAIFAFIAIYESRRSQKLMMHDHSFSKVEEWARNDIDILMRITAMLRLLAPSSRRRKTLESELKTLDEEAMSLKNQMEMLEGEKSLHDIEASAQLEGVSRRLIEITQKRIDIMKELVKSGERELANVKNNLEELVKVVGRGAYGEMIAKPAIHLIGDAELIVRFDDHLDLGMELAKAIEEDNPEKGLEMTQRMERAVSLLLARVTYLRNKIMS